MNSFDPWETPLRRWKLRPPSPALKQRLFPRAQADPPSSLEAHAWSWLAPALGCLLVLATLGSQALLLRRSGGFHLARSFSSPEMNLEIGLRKAISAQLDQGQNVLQVAFFEWTNTRSLPSSNGSFRLLTTNGLRN